MIPPVTSANRLPLLGLERDNLRSCIRCGLCLSVCPTYQETMKEEESPRGRIAIASAFLDGHLAVTEDLIRHEYSCLLCEACTDICPTGVQMDRIMTSLRVEVQREVPRSWQETIFRKITFDYFLLDLGSFRKLYGLLRLFNISGIRVLARALGVLKLFGVEKFEPLLPSRLPSPIEAKGQSWGPKKTPARFKVAIFVGCIMGTVFSRTTMATARVLAANGCEVMAVAGQGCCGSLHGHNALSKGAMKLARQNVDAFGALSVDAIIVNAAGCGSYMKNYGGLLANDSAYAERAMALSGKIKDSLEFISEIGLQIEGALQDYTVTYQEPCHLAHTQGVRRAPRELLASIPGAKFVEMDQASMCCGSAGLYNLTHIDMSQRLLERKLEQVRGTGATVIASANPGCLLQLEMGVRRAGLPIRVAHIVDLLDEAFK